MPNLDVAEHSTDLGGEHGEAEIAVNGIGYVTGEPAAAQLRARFAGAPENLDVEWRLEIRSERSERGDVDDRDIPSDGSWVPLNGTEEWDIEAAMGETIGGAMTLFFEVMGDEAGDMPFFVRGKNPLDADAQARITQTVGTRYAAYAWAMAKHESRQDTRVFNQFNTHASIEGTLNFGEPNGWGVCQIDRPFGAPGVSTAEAWDWHENVDAMLGKLDEKRIDFYERFIGYFRDSYGTQTNWTEPPGQYTIGATTLPAEAWGVMVLYNGAAGVPRSAPPSRPQGFHSPWIFDPQTGEWTFHDNVNNYASTRVRGELEGNFNDVE